MDNANYAHWSLLPAIHRRTKPSETLRIDVDVTSDLQKWLVRPIILYASQPLTSTIVYHIIQASSHSKISITSSPHPPESLLMAQFFPSNRRVSASQLFQIGSMAAIRRHIHDNRCGHHDVPTDISGTPQAVIPVRRQRDRTSRSEQRSPTLFVYRPSQSRDSLPGPGTRTSSEELTVQVFDGETTATELLHGCFKYKKVPVSGSTSVRQLVEKLGGGPGWTILSYRNGDDGGFEMEHSVPYNDSDRGLWTMEMFGWGKSPRSAEEDKVVLVLDN